MARETGPPMVALMIERVLVLGAIQKQDARIGDLSTSATGAHDDAGDGDYDDDYDQSNQRRTLFWRTKTKSDSVYHN